MRAHCVSEVDQDVALLSLAGLGYGEQPGGGDFAMATAVAETDLAPLHGHTQHPLHRVVGRLHSLVVEEREEPFEVNEQSCCEVAHFAIGVVQMRFGESEQLLLQRDRFFD